MRVLAIADVADKRLWDMLDRRLLEGVELVLSCGDLPAEYLSFLTCFTRAPILYVRQPRRPLFQKAARGL